MKLFDILNESIEANISTEDHKTKYNINSKIKDSHNEIVKLITDIEEHKLSDVEITNKLIECYNKMFSNTTISSCISNMCKANSPVRSTPMGLLFLEDLLKCLSLHRTFTVDNYLYITDTEPTLIVNINIPVAAYDKFLAQEVTTLIRILGLHNTAKILLVMDINFKF